jgi:hypothetical protein
MADKERKTEAAPKGAVEVDEKDLDQAAGGLNFTRPTESAKPTESLSINFTGLEGEKEGTQDLAGGPHVAPEQR